MHYICYMPFKPQKKIKAQSFKNKPLLNNKLYNSTTWRNLRLFCLQSFPICNYCKRKPSTVADHITPARLGGDFWDIENLQGLCASCHNSKSAKESKIKT